MAMGTTFRCDHCKHEILAWDDGNPYYLDEKGEKQYAYHPDWERLSQCIGNDSDFLCLACGKEFRMDSATTDVKCKRCESTDAIEFRELEGRTCPRCKKGAFHADPDHFAIS
ncbi:MAG: hypothetical protein U0795_19965 [Pirellulales bacterium]